MLHSCVVCQACIAHRTSTDLAQWSVRTSSYIKELPEATYVAHADKATILFNVILLSC